MVAAANLIDEFDDTPWFSARPEPGPAPTSAPMTVTPAPAPLAAPEPVLVGAVAPDADVPARAMVAAPVAPAATTEAPVRAAAAPVATMVMPMMPVAFESKRGAGFVTRAIWYTTVGWWVTGLGMALAWMSAMTIVGLPLSFWLVNRLPTMLTLRPRRERYQWVVGKDGVARAQTLRTEQTTPVLRFAWFLLVGWWASAIWMLTAYVMLLSIVLTPFGLLMVNRVPFVFSLHRGYA